MCVHVVLRDLPFSGLAKHVSDQPRWQAHFVDCTDSFWEVACTTETDADTDTQGDIQSGTDGSDTKTDTDIILGELIAIDDDPVARGDVHNETLRELGVTAIMNQAICGFWLTPLMTETSHEATFHGKPGRP